MESTLYSSVKLPSNVMVFGFYFALKLKPINKDTVVGKGHVYEPNDKV